MALSEMILLRARTMRPGQEVEIPAGELETNGRRYRLKLSAYRELTAASPNRFLLRRDDSSGAPVFFAMKTRKPPPVGGRGRMSC